MRALEASYVAGFLSAVAPFVIFKREHVRRGLCLLPQLDKLRDGGEFLRLARDVDAFATLNYSKTKRVTAVDVERHLRSTGVLAPVTTSSQRHSEGMAS